jgi:hypothetical protein
VTLEVKRRQQGNGPWIGSSEICGSCGCRRGSSCGRQHGATDTSEVAKRTAGVARSGHVLKGIPQEPGRPPRLLQQTTGVVHPTATDQAPCGNECTGKGSERSIRRRYRPVKGDRRLAGRTKRSLTTLQYLRRWGNLGCANGGKRGTHWREGGNKPMYRLKGT